MTKKKNTDPKHAAIILNPKSGGGNSVDKSKMIYKKVIELGWKGKIIKTTRAEDAGEIAGEAIKKGIRHIVVCGGDGTVRAVLGRVIEKDVVLGIVPLGTGNVLARNLGISPDMNEAVLTALYGKLSHVDVGKANGHTFALVAGMGIDVEVMGETNKKEKGRWGILAYVFKSLTKLAKPSDRYRIIVDDREEYVYRAKSILVANMGKTAGGIDMVPGAGLTSGDLRIGIVEAHKLSSWLELLVSTLTGNINQSPHYRLLGAKKVEIHPLGGPKPYECDGEKFPPTDTLKTNIYPKALSVLVPTEDMNKKVVSEERKIVVFDFDGTLVDSLQLMISIFNNLSRVFEFSAVSPEDVDRLRGKSAQELMSELNINKLKLPLLLAQGKEEFKKRLPNITLFPGIKEVLLTLKKSYGLGIVTSNDSHIVSSFLKLHDLDIFDFLDSDKSLFGKGKVLRKMLKTYSIKPSQVIYIGDEVRDIEAARECGIKIISVSWGFNSRELLLKNKPDYLADKPADIPKILTNYWK